MTFVHGTLLIMQFKGTKVVVVVIRVEETYVKKFGLEVESVVSVNE